MKKLRLHANQKGIVSFFVTMIIMIVLTLIVVAFGQLVNREQRQASDRQLNTQAFYAAESGVNDAKNALRNAPANSPLLTTDYTSTCNGFTTAAGLTPTIDANISYSCLLVDNSPPELRFSSVPTTQSITTPINSANNDVITSLRISWEDASGGTNRAGCPAVGAYPDTWTGCDIGMLRVELVPFTKRVTSARSRAQLIEDRAIAFLQPERASVGSGAFTYASASGAAGVGQGLRHMAVCDGSGPRLCSVLITTTDLRQGYLRMRSLYRRTAVTVQAFTGGAPGTGQVDLSGAQVEVDSTGRASDVIKRIKVSFPIPRPGEPSAEFALQSTRGICKRLDVIPTPPASVTVGFFDPTGANNPCNPWQQVNY